MKIDSSKPHKTYFVENTTNHYKTQRKVPLLIHETSKTFLCTPRHKEGHAHFLDGIFLFCFGNYICTWSIIRKICIKLKWQIFFQKSVPNQRLLRALLRIHRTVGVRTRLEIRCPTNPTDFLWSNFFVRHLWDWIFFVPIAQKSSRDYFITIAL